jgi:hypothetical protein
VLILKWNFFRIEKLNSKWLILGFCIKLTMGIALWFIYTYYYTDRATADIYKYYDDALVIFNATKGDWLLRLQFLSGFISDNDSFNLIIQNTQHWDRNLNEPFNDNPVLIRLNLFLLLISQGLFHIHTLFFSFVSFLGSIALLKFFKQYSSAPTKVLFLILFIVPSIIFWSSGVLKEAWLFFCLGFGLLFFQNLMSKQNAKNLIGFFVFVFLLYHIKPYVILSMIPALVFLRLDSLFQWKNKTKAFFISQIAIFTLLLSSYSDKIFQIIKQKKSAFVELAVESKANSLIDTDSYNNLLDVLFKLPTALFTTLFRPGLWEVTGVFTLLSAVENFLFIGILALPILFFKKPNPKEVMLVLFSLSFIVILGSLIGLTTPVLGAIVRYKIPLLPFYLIAVFTFVDFKKIPFINKNL